MKPYYYIYRVGNGNSNVKHSTIESARKEAERICNQHPGSVFEILKCLAIVRCTQASTFWMDGEQPPEKPRYEMLSLGEEVIDGDQYEKVGAPGVWVTTSSTGYRLSCYNAPHRRPVDLV